MKKLGIIVLLTIGSTGASMAQLIKVNQEVFGMDCAPCAYGLERGLKKMAGLEKVRVSLNDGKAYLNLASGNSLTLQKIQEEVKRNGFSARNAEVELKGELTKKGNGWLIKVNNEIFHIASNTDDAITAILSPGSIQVKGVIKDEEDNHLDSKWDIRVTKII